MKNISSYNTKRSVSIGGKLDLRLGEGFDDNSNPIIAGLFKTGCN